MKNNLNSNKRISLANLVCGYTTAIAFIILIMLNVDKSQPVTEIVTEIVEINNTIVEEKLVYMPSDVTPSRYVDHLDGVVLNDPDPVFTVVENKPIHIERDVVVDDVHQYGAVESVIGGTRSTSRDHALHRSQKHGRIKEDVYDRDVDLGLLDRRIAQQELYKDETDKAVARKEKKFGLDKDGVNLANLTIARDSDEETLGEIDLDFDDSKKGSFGLNKGELYAYNFPGQGVGAGIGSGAIGAGAGGGAGLGAGIGEAIYNGETVPTLGGIGTYTSAETPGEGGGVGGLIGGAGAGGAAGLMTGIVTELLGVGPGAPGSGGGGYNYDHLPENGELHIMMHVDGSGSILRTRKQLEIMRNTLLKDALLPYYNNDESLYNRRVIIVDGSGERTLNFFTQAAAKDNVLAVVFQDEAQPSYHLPNFNKKPEGHYSEDLKRLKYLLAEYRGMYRGVMFQVGDKVFSKAFKEFVENAWRGEGYLKNDNLSKYYWQENKSQIDRMQGVVFSDEYHADPTGDPEYYLNLIFTAAKKIGIDLNKKNGGLHDGKNI